MIRACWLLVLAPSALLFTPRVAEACSPARCVGGAIAPSDQGTVPANLPGLLWHPLIDVTVSDGTPDPTKVTITRLGDATPVPFTAKALTNQDVLLMPGTLIVGETYEVNDATTCEGAGASVTGSTFAVRAATPLPTTLGTLASSDQLIDHLDVSTYSGSCTSEVTAAQRTIWLRMDPGTDEWIDLLQIQTFVDDRPWVLSADPVHGAFGTRTAGASVQVYRTCVTTDVGADPGLSAGAHTVRMEATLPGSSVVVASNTVTVELDCQGHGKDIPPATDDGGCNTAGAGSLSWLGVALGALLVRRRARR